MPDANSYGFFRFLTGIGGIATFMVTSVITMEYVGAKYTMFVGIAIISDIFMEAIEVITSQTRTIIKEMPDGTNVI